MIKKILFSLFISFVGLISFSSAGYTRQIGNYGFNPYSQGYDINLTRNGNPLTQNLGYTKQLFLIYDGSYGYSYTARIFWWWSYNGLPYVYYQKIANSSVGNAYFLQGNITSYSSCSEITSVENTSKPGNCSNHLVGDSTKDIFANFLSSVTKNDYYYFEYYNAGNSYDWNGPTYSFCISSHLIGNSLCFGGNEGTSYSSSIGLSAGLDFDTINSSYLYNPPSSNGNGDIVVDEEAGGIELSSDQSAINYFETRYGRDKNLCYVGIDNLTDLWGSSVSFEAGSGLNIFQVYSGLYGNPELNRVYVWLNSWLLNYEQWFVRDGNPMYLSNYNSGTNQVDLYYDNLTFPFSNKPVALYFMADNVENYSEYSTQGSEVVSYCNMVINEGTFDDIIDESTKNNINGFTEQYNKSKGLNKDGSKIVVDFSQFGQYTGDAWITSGQEVAFSGDTSIRNVLKDFFDFGSNITDYTGSSEQTRSNTRTTTNPILPNFIIWSLLFVLLFKFLKRR